jgi:tetratricopeptide (TPR) repeat protein
MPVETLADALTALGECYGAREAEKSLAVQREVVALLEAHPERSPTALWNAKQNLGRALYFLDRYDEALVLASDVLAGRERVFGPDSGPVARSLVSRAGIAFDQEHYAAAQADYERADTIYRKIHGSQAHPDLAASAYNLGLLYDYGFNDAPRAIAALDRAARIGEQVFAADSMNLATFRGQLGDTLLRNRRAAEAEPLLRQAAANLPASTMSGYRSRMELAQIELDHRRIDAARILVEECRPLVEAKQIGDPQLVQMFEDAAVRLGKRGKP